MQSSKQSSTYLKVNEKDNILIIAKSATENNWSCDKDNEDQQN